MRTPPTLSLRQRLQTRLLPLIVGLVLCAQFACISKKKEEDAVQPGSQEAVPGTEQPSQPEPSSTTSEGAVEIIDGNALRQKLKLGGKKGYLVNAWASWCGPCKREFPMLVELKKKWETRGIELIFVSVDEEEDADKALAFARSHGLTGKIYLAQRPLGAFKQALHPKWPGMLPASFLYDESSELRFFWGGPVYEKELSPVLEGLLAGEAIDGEQLYGLQPGKIEN